LDELLGTWVKVPIGTEVGMAVLQEMEQGSWEEGGGDWVTL
jgi:hypothetical protein